MIVASRVKRYLMLSVIVAVSLLSACIKGHVATYTSPDSRFRVDLSEESKILWETTASFSLYEGNKLIDKEIYLDTRDDLGSVLDQFPTVTWVSDSILRFENIGADSSSETDDIMINNRSDKRIEYLVVTLGDLMIINDIAPNERRTIKVRRTGFPWFSVHGKLENASKPKDGGINFVNDEKLTGRVTYCVQVTDSEIKVGSQNLIGYLSPSIDGKRPKTDVPARTNCD